MDAMLAEAPAAATDSRRVKISIRGAEKRFGDMVALKGVDLDLYENSFTCLLGPSGCGKSTLLNMIAGFTQPTAGQVLVDGKAVQGPSADRGVVFQEYALFPWRTAIDNVAFGPMLKGMPKAQQREIAKRYLAMVGLAGHEGKYPGNLSGGMKQRVAIARALANDPSVLLMDEPFGALDAQTRETLQEEMLRIWEHERKTVVFVTHSISEAIFLADRIVVMATKPGAVKQVFDLDLPRPRERSESGFVRLEKEIKLLVRAEVQKLGVI
ncbi:ABC transporter ATP-binding protein [Siccirubricoccus sp. KC 17139]|uniref:ABC transporter ATP-binding protein n=1 Tax=Siccirubricoccus soli TaxID=2899147 RepID=A0ABT1D5V1_9PROT|nr:ABC transporter ATP-binding protein [Siccirubricoccus soli]MCO6417313.1 ABC transporter ATP-binding protein [Siccirubricoccus soli]MCP2683448.1 ABC transporter ATP-binding protein [Siccirubricoccus soli]